VEGRGSLSVPAGQRHADGQADERRRDSTPVSVTWRCSRSARGTPFAGRILLVNPNYKPDWDMPGGMAEANESPLDAARREIREELGLALTIDSLLYVVKTAPAEPAPGLRAAPGGRRPRPD
jgi:8-oxo-dGTP pyrophosphatase MutT (NUDIX family)